MAALAQTAGAATTQNLTLTRTTSMVKSASNTTLPRPKIPGRNNFLSRSKSLGQVVGDTGSEAAALLGNLQKGVKDLEDEITSDEKSLQEMDRNLQMMREEANRLKRHILEEEKVVEAMSPEHGLGKAMQNFDGFMGDCKRTYVHLRGKHKDNIDILKKEFGYNPAYKRGKGGDEFSAGYHTMAKDPSKLPAV
mmetsp:Transcript_99079/g.212252  ORF Transcript_99079/g.212252 Transcript_99079/m.212252 type:complete len:193 (-) Transcript_99079:76-654(-)